jgi:hypothetical protein
LFLGITHSLSGLALPFDLGLLDRNLGGCAWHSDLTLGLPVGIPSTRVASLSLAIPNDIHLRGSSLHNQVYLVGPGLRSHASNVHALAIE